EIGDKNLVPERSYNLNAEGQYNSKKFTAEVSLYSQFINNFIYLKPSADLLTIRGYFKTFNYTQTDAWLSGTDVTLQYHATTHLNVQAKTSILRARDYTQKDWLILMPADRVSMNAKYSFDLNKRWKECYISVEGMRVFKQIRIPRNFDSIDY